MSPFQHSNNSLDNPNHYFNRELSWLAFNKRVLEEAQDTTNPLLERLKFLAIFSSNLDEFYMVRVAGLKDQLKFGHHTPDPTAKLTPTEQLEHIARLNHSLVEQQYHSFDQLQKELESENIYLRTMDSLTKEEKQNLEIYFDEYIYPVLTPMAIDRYRPFPMLMNRSMNIAVSLKSIREHKTSHMAIVQVPALLGRYVQLNNQHHYLLIEDVMSTFINKLFQGYHVQSITQFRITRNADLTFRDDGARDLLEAMEQELKKRKRGAAVRLEVRNHQHAPETITFLQNTLELEEKDIYKVNGPLDLTFLFSFYQQVSSDHKQLTFPTFEPNHPQAIEKHENIFDAAIKRDIFIHHPYEAFTPVVDLITQAADDPDVLAIKQTLYRVSGDSPIISGLKRAAETGKQVTVLVELKARFDEEQNVHWAKELEQAGCHVIYGMDRLKTHSKVILIVRKQQEKPQRFVHLGTGNYNDQTARQYTDMGLITTKRKFAIDATNFFNYMSGYTEKPIFHHLSIAPFEMRQKFIDLIDAEMNYHHQEGHGRIITKMNSLTDKPLIKKLYQASQAGVKIDLIVRGICCLKPGIKGVSDNITVISIVGRFLEHSRIYYFHHGGDEKLFLSSADMMKRNMVERVEVLFPVVDNSIKQRIKDILLLLLSDNVKARQLASDGTYHYVLPKQGQAKVNSQLALCHRSDNEESM
ncbi:RNA degradosome polyphosphate kinase [Aquibacillus sediminis]|uniref:RNA degradosome polyphosphate kinase n=1 Tax=Aquibacillus sediminis TaxID=2574734 RepID=UPI0011089D03|nr:RNA degradosome polyphosphate kinase [Aquibacillus sediminis]